MTILLEIRNMDYSEILKEIKGGKFRTTYFLAGEETYYIDMISDYIENNILEESEKSFNQTVMYGRDVEVQTLISVAKQFPMMSSRTVIIVKEAQDLKKIDELNSYISQPLISTILVICYRGRKLDKRKTLYKSLIKNGIYFESTKLYENKISAWISSYLKKINRNISSKSAAMLTDFLGNDLSKISSELDKLCLLIPINSEITEQDIEENIGISKDYNNFELQNAIMNKDAIKANKIIKYFKANPKKNPAVVTLSTLYNLFSKILKYHGLTEKNPQKIAKILEINPFFVNDYKKAAKLYNLKDAVHALSVLREVDLKSKGYKNRSVPESELLKELVYKLCY